MPHLDILNLLAILCFVPVIAAGLQSRVHLHDTRTVQNSSTPPPPSQDPWYKAPPGYEGAKPGQVLKVRRADGLAQLVNASAAYNLLYRTTDSSHQASWAVTTLYLPRNTSYGTALLSYQVAYDSPNVNDSPSYAFYTGLIDPPIPQGLAQGWMVNVPDYEGPFAAFTAGMQSGQATLDSIRAVLNHEGWGRERPQIALSGYSGGAFASGWAAELQPQYAPKLPLAGVALGGLPPNITSVYESVNQQWSAELIVTSVLGITAEFPAAREYIVSQLTPTGPYNASTFLAALHQNTTMDLVAFLDQNIFDYFKDGDKILENPIFRALLDRDGNLGYHGTPTAPMYIYKAVNDEISKVADTDGLVRRYCAAGANIVYQRNNIGGHVAEATNGAPGAMTFLQQVLNGNYSHSGCTIQTLTVGNDTSPL